MNALMPFIRTPLVIAVLAASLHGAVLRGVVVENQTGRPLSRALLTAQPIPGTGGAAQTARTGAYGAFEFAALAPGAYIVSASRRGFATTQYGQKQWKSAGAPVIVEEKDAAVLNIRLPRFGAITGTILDENDVGVPDYDVMAYRNTRPPQLISRGKSDDRGVFRISGLEPGSYVVRTSAHQDQDGGYLPTFGKQTSRLEQALTVDVDLDRSSDLYDIRPVSGRLFDMGGQVILLTSTTPCQPVKVTLAGEMIRESIDTCGAFHFGRLAPGRYELYAEGPGDNRAAMSGAHMMFSLERDETGLSLTMRPLDLTSIRFGSASDQTPDTGSHQVLARRKDLTGVGEAQLLRLANGRAPLGAGRWELMLVPESAAYVAAFSGSRVSRDTSGKSRPDGWNEITVDGYGMVRFALAGNPASVTGTVKAGGDVAPGAPVFLEAYDATARERVMEPRMVRADMRGQYRFQGVAPGTYRILSTFEYQIPDADSMTNAGAQTVIVDAGQTAQMTLELYAIR